MYIGLLFWILMILGFIFGFWSTGWSWKGFGGSFALWVCIALLGWKVFGPALHN